MLCYLHAHVFDPSLTVQAALDECGICTARIYARFKWHVGQTMARYVRELRLSAAKELLKTDHLTLDLVAFGVGFNNYSTFRRAFKRHLECPPSTYREGMGGGN